MRQKKIALVNDVTGFGRCSVTVELPIISALKIQVCPLPTALLSVHTGFKDYFMDDFTDRMEIYIDSWQKNNLTFDAIATGFLGSAAQIVNREMLTLDNPPMKVPLKLRGLQPADADAIYKLSDVLQRISDAQIVDGRRAA